MAITRDVDTTFLTICMRLPFRVLSGAFLRRSSGWHVAIACFISIYATGCASNYEPKPDLDSVETIGVVLPDRSSEPMGADDVITLYNRTVGEDRLKNSAVGAGSGAAVGTAVGIGAAALTGCALTGPWAPLCWIAFGGGGAVLGGGTGAVAGATVDTQERVEVAPVHLYEVNKMLPALQNTYLERTDLEARALRLLRQRNPDVSFMPATSEGNRYRLVTKENLTRPYTDVNLVLTDLRFQFVGKAKDDPDVALMIHTQWVLEQYDSSTNLKSDWDVLTGEYQSKKHLLSEWKNNGSSLLISEIDKGLEKSLTEAFSRLGPETEQEKWARISPEDSF
jgi:hypothetical protein